MHYIDPFSCDTANHTFLHHEWGFQFFCAQMLVLSVIFILNVYVVFCYCFRRFDEPFKSHQYFIILLSLQAIFSTIIHFLYFIFLIIDYFEDCVWTAVFWTDGLEIHFSACFLAVYRYYRVCKPIKQFLQMFSGRRLALYYTSLLVLIFVNIFTDAMECEYVQNAVILKFIDISRFAILNLLYLIGIVFTIYAYVSVIQNMEQSIRSESIPLVKFAVPKSPGDFSSGLSHSFNAFLCSNEMLQEEKHYVASIRVYSIVLVAFLIVRYMAWFFICLEHAFYGVIFNYTLIYIIYNMVSLFLVFFYFTSNFVLFYENNAEFQLKLIRPIRHVKALISEVTQE